MNIFNKKSFHESIWFCVRFSSLLGYYFFSLKRGDEENLVFAYTKFIFFLIFGIYASIKSAEISEIDMDGTSSMIIKIAVKLLMQFTLYMPTFFRINNFILRHSQRKIYSDIEAIDEKLIKILGQRINIRRYYKVFVSVTTFYITFLFMIVIVDNQITFQYFYKSGDITLDPVTPILALYTIIAYLSFQLNHAFLICTIKTRFDLISTACLDGKSKISEIGKIYNKLNEVLSSMNSSYGINLLYFFGNYMTFTIFNFFILTTTITNENLDSRKIAYSVLMSLYWTYYTIYGISLISLSNGISSADEKIRKNLNKKMETKEEFKRGNLINIQFSHQSASISCGVLTVNLEYLFILISCLFSYLIILIQFESE